MVTLVNIRDHYRKTLGRDVSTSVIMRRALALLADHLEGRRNHLSSLLIGGDEAEAQAILRAVR